MNAEVPHSLLHCMHVYSYYMFIIINYFSSKIQNKMADLVHQWRISIDTDGKAFSGQSKRTQHSLEGIRWDLCSNPSSPSFPTASCKGVTKAGHKLPDTQSLTSLKADLDRLRFTASLQKRKRL